MDFFGKDQVEPLLQFVSNMKRKKKYFPHTNEYIITVFSVKTLSHNYCKWEFFFIQKKRVKQIKQSTYITKNYNKFKLAS